MIQFRSAQMGTRNYKKTFLLLLLTWFLVNMIQALFMEIMSDEAYYGLYGRYLAWGYYDHPPMVALLVKISSVIFKGNLGIRFMTVLLQLGTLLIIWKIIDLKDPDSTRVITFFIIAGSIIMFSAYGIITSPDAPLLFFTALFLYGYKKFLFEQKWSTAFLLSVSMAGLIYSKYQAVLVIGFVVLSNMHLLKTLKFWLAGILALILLAPHIHWQFANNFPSFQYHLVDRSEDFRFIYFLEYLPNQLAVFNPLTLGAVLYVLIKYRPADKFTRSLYFLVIGFIGFFWLISFRGHVEPHWTIACSIPMIILLSDRSCENQQLFRFTRKYILPSIFLILALRIFLMTSLPLNTKLGFSGKKEKYKYIESVAKDLPVVFTGSFQQPSLYTFFTGKDATVISSVISRQTQFDILQLEKKFHNKPVLICVKADGMSQVYGTGRLKFDAFKTDSLQTVNRMKITFRLDQQTLQPGDSINVPFTLQNSYNHSIDFNHNQFPVEVCMVFIQGEKIFVQQASLSEPVNTISDGVTLERTLISVIPALIEGEYKFGLCLNTLFGPSLNSRFVRIKIGNND
ncbi:MAG: glycosyltransferase family 39 protein [Bacteroidales bacterium]|nr:glycosyltransferase family 39 protein [Bacteroidales bacterium]